MISLNKPIIIEGKSCILMRDVLGSAPSEKYTSQEQGKLRVWYEEEALRETRDANPKTPIYGFWQTLIASGQIDTSKRLQFIYTTDTRDYGFYLYSNNGELHTGSLFNQELQRLPGLAVQEGITLEDGEEITVNVADLKLPSTELLTHKERVQAAAEQKKKAQQQGFLTAALIGGIALLIDTGLAYQHEQHMDAFNQVNNELHAAEQALTAVYRQKLAVWPSQVQSLSTLYQISSTFADSALSGEVSLLPNKSAVIHLQEDIDIGSKLTILANKGINAKRISANTTTIEWVNDEAF